MTPASVSPRPIWPPRPRPRLRVAVVGSGFGGLAAAIRLQAAGVETTLLEARERPGGRAYVWQRDGFTFDMGPTVITDPTLLEDLFRLAGSRLGEHVELLPVDPLYRLLWPDGDRLDYCADGAALEAEIVRRNPADGAGYRRFHDYAGAVFKAGYEELAATPFLRFWDMVRAAPQLATLRADRSVYRAVAGFIRDERVRQALSFHSLLVGGNPFETSAIYTLIHYLERRWGVFFPRGGIGTLVGALATLFTSVGGRLLLQSPVHRIEVTGSRGGAAHLVTFASNGDERRERFDAVVSNADVHHTYAALYRGYGGGRPAAPPAGALHLVDVPVRAVLRHRPRLPRPGSASHRAVRTALSRAAGRHFSRQRIAG